MKHQHGNTDDANPITEAHTHTHTTEQFGSPWSSTSLVTRHQDDDDYYYYYYYYYYFAHRLH